MKNPFTYSVEEIKSNVAPIFDQYSVGKAAIFGSCARGEMKPDSDIDIVISFLQPVGLLKLIGLKQALEENLRCKVDLITYNSLNNSDIKEKVLSEAIVIYDKETLEDE